MINHGDDFLMLQGEDAKRVISEQLQEDVLFDLAELF